LNHWLKRSSAVLLHITSLAGPFHKGVLGQEAKDFIDSLVSGGFKIWQFLPLGPTHDHGSPYESLSTFAGNPELIDLRDCANQGWLDANVLHGNISKEQHHQYRRMAGDTFWKNLDSHPELKESVSQFQEKQSYWLDDFSLFSALKEHTGNSAWWQWSTELRDRKENALKSAKEEHAIAIQQVIFEQFLFDQQWQQLKTYAEDKGVQLFGDLPIYVAHDSADVWANREFFTVNEHGLCDEVAGVPADYFSKTGQRWGNPLYRWNALQEDGFAWWVRRVKRQLEMMHMLRIDHFLALNAFWAIPGDRDDGLVGEWINAPGKEMLQALQDSLGTLPLIAEDLGTITKEVTALRESFSLPGMKILHFAFGGDTDNPYLPDNHEENSVVYTGTHDNDTTMGWFKNSETHVRQHALEVLQAGKDDMPWAMIEAAIKSPALMSVIPMQDLLELGDKARFNTPGTLGGNWQWRLKTMPKADSTCWSQALKLNQQYKR